MGSHHLPGVTDAYFALGQGEQIIGIVPSLNITFAVVSSSWASSGPGFDVLRRIGDMILPLLLK